MEEKRKKSIFLPCDVGKLEAVLGYAEEYMWNFRDELLKNLVYGRMTKNEYGTRDDELDKYIVMGFKYSEPDVLSKESLKNKKPESGVVSYDGRLKNGGKLAFWYCPKDDFPCYIEFLGKLMERFWLSFRGFVENLIIRYSGNTNVPDKYEISVLERERFANEVYETAVFSQQEFIAQELRIDLKAVNNIAGMSYEKRGNNNSAILFVRDVNTLGSEAGFKRLGSVAFSNKNAREVRKLLEMTNITVDESGAGKGTMLVVDVGDNDFDTNSTPYVVGICKLCDSQCLKSRYWLEISCRGVWNLRYDNQLICGYQNGFYQAFKLTTEEKLNQLKDEFGITDEMKKIIMKAERVCGHGAILVCFPDSDEEGLMNTQIKRLTDNKYGYRIEPKFRKLDEESIKLLTSLDGAIFLDREGNCYAVGVILDGVAQKTGTTARGSRYNSTLRYLDNLQDGSVYAVVISEDGGVDLLKPRIKDGGDLTG